MADQSLSPTGVHAEEPPLIMTTPVGRACSRHAAEIHNNHCIFSSQAFLQFQQINFTRRIPMRHRLLRISLIVSLTALSFGAQAEYGDSTNGLSRVMSCGTVGGDLRIMPLGDSITEAAAGHNSYRRNLWFSLAGEGCQIDFVGSQTGVYGAPSAPNGDFDQNHEGHWGWRIDQIATQVAYYVAVASPDIVLIHLGSNDIFQGENPANVAQELGDLIDRIREAKPDTRIMLAKLIPASYRPQGITALNSAIDGVVSSRNYPSFYPPVILVDQASGYRLNDNYDGVHPAPSGEAKLAQRWSQSILSLRYPGAIYDPPYSTLP
jgi:acyl-CoA thioesterase I